MSKRSFAVYVLALLALPSVSAAAALTLHSAKEIAVAGEVNRAISVVSAAVAKCATSSPPATCACRVPEQLQKLRSSYAAAVRQFPAWRGGTVTWREVSGQTVVIAFDGLERQLHARCP